jgi:hypothetical protein
MDDEAAIGALLDGYEAAIRDKNAKATIEYSLRMPLPMTWHLRW